MGSSYSNAQSQTIGVFNDPTAGWMNYGAISRELSKIVPQANVDTTKLLTAIVSKTKISSDLFFGKILSYSTKEVKLYAASGRTSDQATHAQHLYYVKIDSLHH